MPVLPISFDEKKNTYFIAKNTVDHNKQETTLTAQKQEEMKIS